MNFVSTCAAGLEKLVADELNSFGARISGSKRGEIRWSASLQTGYRACLWSRFSSRLVLILAEFAIETGDDLYEAALPIAWEDHLLVDDSFSVDCVLGGGGPVRNSMYGALRIKDGIVDRFRERQGSRPEVSTQRPAVKVYLHIHEKQALLGLDLSGEGLHRRGYRAESGPAPLKENLAAAIIALSGWDGQKPLIDPMCGSATLLIEAALIRADSAPGLGRTYYGFTGWRGHQKKLWAELVDEALEREAAADQQQWPPLIGYDGDRAAVRAARKNIAGAGFQDRVQVDRQEINQLRDTCETPGFLVCNPPYGERLSDTQSIKHLYLRMGECFQRHFAHWRVTLFTAAPDYADRFRQRFDNSVKIFNGPLACRLFSGSPLPLADPEKVKDWQISTAMEGGEATELANRLKKNFRKFHPWACARELDWYRLYDRDLPQFNVSIDVVGGRFFISEFPIPAGKDPGLAARRFSEVTHTVRTLFNASRDQVAVQRSRPAKKNSRKKGARHDQFEIREGDAVFLVGSEGDLDWPFHPDQRFVRKFLAQTMSGGNFLSLFDTSGGAAIGVALAGARKTVTLGISARNAAALVGNFSRNGLHPHNHHLCTDEVMGWLKRNRESFDLIYIYFRQKRYRQAGSSTFTVASDQRDLIELTLSSLAPGGRLVVSSVLPKFELDPTLTSSYDCRDMSRKLHSPDLRRGARNFRCWEISRRALDESRTS